MEAALDVLAEKLHVSEEKLKKEYEFIKEYPFDSEVKRMTKIWAPNDQEWIAFVKGATELILDRSSSYTGVNDERQALDTDMKKTIRDEIDSWATKGFRTLGIASKELEKRENENAYSRDEVEKDLNFIGFVIIQDPPRDGVIDAVKECEAAGVKVVMITGDSPTTGAAIGSELGIYQEGETVYEGKDVRELPEKEFESTAVFARVSPADKQQIVQRYQDKDKVVAMTGDGVNDALALGMADIGLAMGISGTDVAKEAADMIISDDSFNTIERGIREGRGLFAKIRVMMYFFVYANLTEAIILFTTSFVHPDFRLFDTAWQIQLIYILPHSIPPLGLTFDRTSSDIMREKPRDEEEIFNRNVMILMIANISTLAIGLAIASIPIVNAFFMNPSLIGSTDPADIAQLNANMARPRTIALAVVFIIEVLTLFSVRRPNIPVYKSFRKDMSPLFLIFAVGTLLSLFFIIYVESVAESFLLVPLTGEDWLVVMALGLPALPILEIIKVVLRKKGEHF